MGKACTKPLPEDQGGCQAPDDAQKLVDHLTASGETAAVVGSLTARSGDLRLRAAQNGAHLSDTKILADTYLSLTRMV